MKQFFELNKSYQINQGLKNRLILSLVINSAYITFILYRDRVSCTEKRGCHIYKATAQVKEIILFLSLSLLSIRQPQYYPAICCLFPVSCLFTYSCHYFTNLLSKCILHFLHIFSDFCGRILAVFCYDLDYCRSYDRTVGNTRHFRGLFGC